MKVQITSLKDYLYPDVVVTFDENDISADANRSIIRTPSIIVEVLSASSRVYDQTDKFLKYKKN
jgi:Uma2 family endonuclease